MPKRDALLWARALVRETAKESPSAWPGIVARLLTAMEKAGDRAWIARVPAVLGEAIRREGAPALHVQVAPSTDTAAWREELARALQVSVADIAWTSDAALVAGARVCAPGWTIDASVAGRLEALRATLSV
jgi:hypothetical protein